MNRNYFKVLLTPLFTLFYFTTFAQLSEGGIPAGYKFTNVVRLETELMPPVDLDALAAEDAIRDQYKGHPFRFGYNHIVNFNLNNSGTWITLSNGDRVWQLDIKSPGALTINLAFSNMYLPEGAKLFVYSKGKEELLGAFTSRDNKSDGLFGTELINDEEVIVEYDEPLAVAGRGTLTVFRVTHGYRGVGEFVKSFGDAGTCMKNVNCPQFIDWADQKRSVVCLVSGGSEFCTGALVNNTANDGTPYILSANHCGPADNTWIFRFNWEASGCTNPATSPASQSISGCTQVASNAGSDFLLCRMSSIPPANYNVFYAGWNNANVAATSATCIHHPSGDIKKLSIANNATISSTYSGAACWRVGQWTDGVTEPGSSGSPLFDQNKRIIGQLYGGPSSCGASTANLNDYYGKFSTSWNTGTTTATRLREWLDPANTGTATLDGYDPNAAVLAYDAAITTITSPSGSTCNTTITPVVTLRNSGTTTLTSVTISYQVDGGTTVPFSWNGSLASLQTASVTLPSSTLAAGPHTISVTVFNPNNNTDQNLANNTGNSSFTILSPTPSAIPFYEGFIANTFPPTGWTVTNPNNNATWARSTAAGGFGTSTNSARIDQGSGSTSTTGQFDDLTTPYINFSSITSPASLAFDVAYAKYNNTYFDSLVILVSSDCGATWSRLYAKGGTQLATAPNTTGTFVPTSTQWRRDSITLNQYVGQPFVQFRFQSKSGYGNPLFIDNINIRGAVPLALDASVNTLTVPSPLLCNPTFNPTFTLTNYGQSDLSNVTIYYSIDNGLPTSYDWSGTLTNLQSQIVSLPTQTLSNGNHSISIFSSNPNGSADGNNTNDTLRLSFSIGDAPVVELGNDTSMCGGTLSLSAVQSGAAYQWSTGSTGGSVLVTSSGTYQVTVTRSGCSATDSRTVVINTIPSASLGQDRSICGNSYTINAPQVTGTYLWSTSETSQTLTVTNSGNYRLTVTSTAGCTASDDINVTLNTIPTVTFELLDDTLCLNTTAITLSGGSPAGGAYSGSNVVQNSFTPNSTGVFSITYAYTDANGCSGNAADNLVVDVCAGMNDLNNIAYRIYPNPFTNQLLIELNKQFSEDAIVKVVDVSGAVIASNVFKANSTTLSFSTDSWSAGVYYITLQSNDDVSVRKVVKW